MQSAPSGSGNGALDPTDVQLLGRFIDWHDPDAFKALVERHGPMVLAVCRTVLGGNRADAEDAFQAVFFILARKADSIGNGDALAGWLYRVAHRVALQAKEEADRRRERERRTSPTTPVLHERDPAWRESLAAIREEIDRLPEKYRTPIILCYLEGLTHESAAGQLGWPVGTVRGRLSRAREILRKRLMRRGLALSVTGALAATFAIPGTAPAAIPPPLVNRTIETAMGRDPDSDPARLPVIILAEGALKAMYRSRMRKAAIILLAAALAMLGLGAFAHPGIGTKYQSPAASIAAEGPAEGIAIDEGLARAVSGRIIRAEPIRKDCMILDYLPDWGHGDVDNIAVANNDGGVRTLLDWPPIPNPEAKTADRRFIVALYSRETTSDGPPGPLHAFAIRQDWPELTSWEARPDYDPEPSATFKFEPGPGWKLFDITPMVRAEAAGPGQSHGLVLRFLSEDRSGSRRNWSGYQFVSREGAGEWEPRRPVLLVVEPSK